MGDKGEARMVQACDTPADAQLSAQSVLARFP